MRQLSALDAWLVDLESPTATGHVGTLIGVEPDGDAGSWGVDQVRGLLESRLHTVPPLSQRLVGTPLGLGGRYLVEDPHFDIEFHVRELALPAPGTTQQLADQVAGLHARPLDRSRPLWELYVFTGRESGAAAVYAKVHRILIDEVTGTGPLQALLDTEPDPGDTGPEPAPDEVAAPSAADLVGRSLRTLVDPRQLGYLVPDSLHRLGRLAGDARLPGSAVVDGLAAITGRLLGPGARSSRVGDTPAAPRTRLDATLTPHRRLAVGSVSMDDLARACERSGMTAQGVLLAMTAAALRRWLLDHDALPTAPLVAVVPVPVRVEEDASGEAGPRMMPALVELPTHLRGADERAASTRAAMDAATQDLDVLPVTALEDLVATSPMAVPALAARALSAAALAPGISANLAVAHLPGPAQPLYLAGARVQMVAPVSALGDSTGGLAVTSYPCAGRLHLSLTACREIVPDVGHLVGYLTEALDELRPPR